MVDIPQGKPFPGSRWKTLAALVPSYRLRHESEHQNASIFLKNGKRPARFLPKATRGPTTISRAPQRLRIRRVKNVSGGVAAVFFIKHQHLDVVNAQLP